MKYDLWQIDAYSDELGNWVWNDKGRIENDIEFAEDADPMEFLKYAVSESEHENLRAVELEGFDPPWYEIQQVTPGRYTDERPILCFIPTDDE